MDLSKHKSPPIFIRAIFGHLFLWAKAIIYRQFVLKEIIYETGALAYVQATPRQGTQLLSIQYKQGPSLAVHLMHKIGVHRDLKLIEYKGKYYTTSFKKNRRFPYATPYFLKRWLHHSNCITYPNGIWLDLDTHNTSPKDWIARMSKTSLLKQLPKVYHSWPIVIFRENTINKQTIEAIAFYFPGHPLLLLERNQRYEFQSFMLIDRPIGLKADCIQPRIELSKGPWQARYLVEDFLSHNQTGMGKSIKRPKLLLLHEDVWHTPWGIALISTLQPLGFKTITTQTEDFNSLKNLFHQAAFIVGPEDADWRYLPFCQKDTMVFMWQAKSSKTDVTYSSMAYLGGFTLYMHSLKNRGLEMHFSRGKEKQKREAIAFANRIKDLVNKQENQMEYHPNDVPNGDTCHESAL